MGKHIIIILLFFMFYNVYCYDENCQTPAPSYSSSLCLECKTGFYLSYDERFCEECDEQKGKILYLQENYYYTKKVEKCYTKVDNCKEYSETDDFCALCKDGFKRDENGQCVQCEANEIGMYNVCFKKINFCKIYYLYQEGEKCFFCQENYEFNEEQAQCIKCPVGEEAKEGFMCMKECPTGKILSYGECIDKIPNCKAYINNCSRCDYNYRLKKDGTCSKCPQGTTGEGLKCFPLIEGCLYQEDDICQGCSSSDEVLDEERKHCFKKEKIQNCNIQINDKCSECELGYKTSNDQKSCEICEYGKDEDIETCLLYIENCWSISRVINKYKKIMFDCNMCLSSEYYLISSKQQCNDCGKGKYKLNGQCIDEIKNCAKYKSDKECQQCKYGYQIKNGKCLPCVIPYEGSDGKTCHLRHFRCEHDDDFGNCFECSKGYFVGSKKNCVREGIVDKDESMVDKDKVTSNSFSLNINLNIILLTLYGLLI